MACRTNATDWMTGGARNRHRRHERTAQRVPDRNRDVVREELERLLAVGASLLLSTVLEIGDHLANSPNGRRPGRLRAAAARRPEPSPSPTTLGLKLKLRTVCEVLLRGRCSCLILRSEGSILSGELTGLDRRRRPLRRGFARPVTGRFAPENPVKATKAASSVSGWRFG